MTSQPLHFGMRRQRCEFSIAVVLADENDRQLPQAGYVQRFMKGTRLTGTVTEEHDSDLARVFLFGCKGGPQCQRDCAADDAGGGDESSVECDDVHRAALATAIARGPAGDFGHQPDDIGSLCDCMTVRAVTPEHV